MTIATDMLTAYMNAEKALLLGKTVRFGDRILTQEDIQLVQAGRREWERRVMAEQRLQTTGDSGPRFSTPDLTGTTGTS